MRFALMMAGALGAFALLPHGAQAQARNRSDIVVTRGEFAIAPYSGYLVSQKFVQGPLNTKLDVQSAPLYGLQASLPLAPGASLIGSVGYSSGNLNVGLPIIGGISVGTSNTAVFDASAELRFEHFGGRNSRLIPVVEFGGGAIRRGVHVAGLSASTTDFQVSGGLGADMPLSNNLSFRVLAKDYYGKADFGSLGGILTAKTDDLHAVALMGGLRFAF